jgi:hypothetical protein
VDSLEIKSALSVPPAAKHARRWRLMREPEIRDGVADFGMVEYLTETNRIRLPDGGVPYEADEWDQLQSELRAAIRYARKVVKS